MDPTKSENARLALAGELFHGFAPELTAARAQCKHACNRYNTAGELTRRRQIELWRDIVPDTRPLPPPLADEALDDAQFVDEPWVEAPIRIDYGTNVRLGNNVYINFNCTILDTCLVAIGPRTLLASNVSLYSATHPLDPTIRDGTKGPELGKEIHIGADCFIGGSVTICPGVTIGNGSTVGAGSVVTKDVPERCVVAGNPARVLRWLDGSKSERSLETKETPTGVGIPPKADEANFSVKLEVDQAVFGQKNVQEHRMLGDRQRIGVRNELTLPLDDSKLEAVEKQVDSGRLMTKQEWEDEMGRQIAEKALTYGASLT